MVVLLNAFNCTYQSIEKEPLHATLFWLGGTDGFLRWAHGRFGGTDDLLRGMGIAALKSFVQFLSLLV